MPDLCREYLPSENEYVRTKAMLSHERGKLLEGYFAKVLVDLKYEVPGLSFSCYDDYAGLPDFLVDIGDKQHYAFELKNWMQFDKPTRTYETAFLSKFRKIKAYKGYLIMANANLSKECIEELKVLNVEPVVLGLQINEYNAEEVGSWLYRKLRRFLCDLFSVPY